MSKSAAILNPDGIQHTPPQRMLGMFSRVWMNFPAQFAFLAGSVLLFLGTAEIIGALGKPQVLNVHDALLGVPFHYLMLAFAMIQLIAAFVLLFTNWRTLGLGLAAWITADFLVYRIGLWTMGWHHSSGFMVEPLGLSLGTTDAVTSLLSAFLFVGSGTTLWIERRRTFAAASLKMSCHSCGGHIKFARQNLGQKIPCPHCQTTITLRKPENLKMSCFFCQEHIEFPAHSIGEKLQCPHCKKDITLKEPATA